jgi:arylsulfatase A-like enzyme
MELPAGQPFFLALGIRRPHSPWAVPREWFSRVPRSVFRHARINLNLERNDLEDMRGYSASGSRVGSFFRYNRTSRSARTARARLLQAIRHYLAPVAFVDACAGRVLDASPHARNTVVVLWSGHGYSWGQKLQLGKSNLWESSLRPEFIISDLRRRPPKPRQRGPAHKGIFIAHGRTQCHHEIGISITCERDHRFAAHSRFGIPESKDQGMYRLWCEKDTQCDNGSESRARSVVAQAL